MNNEAMSFVGHLAELRRRLIVVMAVFITATLVCFSFTKSIADFIMKPAAGLTFVYLSPPDLFIAFVKLSLSAGLAVSLPIIIYEIWMFVRPALEKRERGSILFALMFSGLFFAAGAAFAYYVIVPFTIRFFLSYSTQMVQPMISIKEYLSFIADLCVAFGVTFEMPIAAAVLGAIGVLKAEVLLKSRRLAILGIFIAAAILTPPDVVSQVLLALPMLALFELSIIILRLQGKGRRKRELELEAEA